jgi:CheY-like chemotaxis protein
MNRASKATAHEIMIRRVAYFYSAAERRSRGALWPSFAPALIVVSFVDPLEALKAAETHSPDILISDVTMPQMNGISLGVQFKAIYPTCLVVLFFGHASTADLLRDASGQGHDFELLTKPIHPKDLLAALGVST